MDQSTSQSGILATLEPSRFSRENELEVGHKIPTLAWSILSNGQVEFVTRSYLRRIGQTLESCLAHPNVWNLGCNDLPPLFASVHPQHVERISNLFWSGIRSGQEWSFEAPFFVQDHGRYQWCLMRAAPVRGNSGDLLRYIGSCTDLENLYDAQVKTAVLFEISNAITKGCDPACDVGTYARIVFPDLCEALRRFVSFDWAELCIFRARKNRFEVIACRDLDGRYGTVSVPEISCDFTSAGWIYEQCRPLVRANLEHQAEFDDEHQLVRQGLAGYAAVPLLNRGDCFGLLRFASASPLEITPTDVEFLSEASRQLALALENQMAKAEIAELKATLEIEAGYERGETRREHDFEGIIGSSPELLRLLDRVESVAPTDASALIIGETGTGKELIARAIHCRSARKRGPLVKVNCGAIPAGLVESELFGHMKGAFTSASERRVGRFELANGGTIFLDEVGELPLDTQVKLLRVLQEREFEPVGSSKTIQVNVRIIAATNRDLASAVQAGTFRSDLYYRLNVVPLQVPPLRCRKQDIPDIADFFLQQSAAKMNRPVRSVSRDTMRLLVEHTWPGNIRELQNVIERGVVLCKGPVLRLGPDLLPVEAASFDTDQMQGRDIDSLGTLEDVQRDYIQRVLDRTERVVSGPKGAATILGMNPNTLHSLMKRLGIRRTVDTDLSDASQHRRFQEA